MADKKKTSKKEIDKKASKDKKGDKKGDKDEEKDKKEEEQTDDDMSACILKGLEQLNELARCLEEQVSEYIRRKGPLEVVDACCMGPITNCGPSCLVTSFCPCPPPCCPPSCCPPSCPKPPTASCSSQSSPVRCPCCGTICTQK